MKSNLINEICKLSADGRQEKQELGNALKKPMELPRTSVSGTEALQTVSQYCDRLVHNLKCSELAQEVCSARQPARSFANVKERLKVFGKLRDAGWSYFVKQPPLKKGMQSMSQEPPMHSCDTKEVLRPSADLKDCTTAWLMEPRRHSMDVGSFHLENCRTSWLVNSQDTNSPVDPPRRSFDMRVRSKSVLGQNISVPQTFYAVASNQNSHTETRRRSTNVVARLMGLEDMPIDSIHHPKALLRKPSKEAKLLQALLLCAPQNPNQRTMLEPMARPHGKTEMSMVRQRVTSQMPVQAGNNVETEKRLNDTHGNEHQILAAPNHVREVSIGSSEKQDTVPTSQPPSNYAQNTMSPLQAAEEIRDNWQDVTRGNEHHIFAGSHHVRELSIASSRKQETVPKSKPPSSSVQKTTSPFQTATVVLTDRIHLSPSEEASSVSMENYTKNDCLQSWRETKEPSTVLDKEISQDETKLVEELLDTMWEKMLVGGGIFQRSEEQRKIKAIEHCERKEQLIYDGRNTSQYSLDDNLRPGDTEQTKNDSHVCEQHPDALKSASERSKWTTPGEQINRPKENICQTKRQELSVTRPGKGTAESVNTNKLLKAQRLAHEERRAYQCIEEAFKLTRRQSTVAASFLSKEQPADSNENLKPVKVRSSTESMANSYSSVIKDLGCIESCSKDESKPFQKMKKVSLTGKQRKDTAESRTTLGIQSRTSRANQKLDEFRKKSFPEKKGNSSLSSIATENSEPLFQFRDGRIPEVAIHAENMTPDTKSLVPKIAEAIDIRDSSKYDNASGELTKDFPKLDKNAETTGPGSETCVLQSAQIHQFQETGRRDNQSTESVSLEVQTVSNGRVSGFDEALSPNSDTEERLMIAKNLESNEHSSPVSVFDILFCEECSPRSIYKCRPDLPDGESDRSLETSNRSQMEEATIVKVTSKTSKSLLSAPYDNFQDNPGPMFMDQTEKRSSICKDDWKPIFCENKSMESLRAMLMSSGFVQVDAILLCWQYLNVPTMSEILDGLKKGGKSSLDGSYMENFSKDANSLSNNFEEVNQQLHLACLCELLAQRLLAFVDTYSLLLKAPTGPQLLEEAWFELQNMSCFRKKDDSETTIRTFERDVTAAPAHWSHYNIEIADMSSRVERMILEEVLQEVIADWPISAANLNDSARHQKMGMDVQATPLNIVRNI